MRVFACLTLGFLIQFLPPGEAAGQQTGTIAGRTQDAQSAQPISSVQISISDLDLGGLTQTNGRYLLVNVPVGTHTLSAQRIGYRAVSVEVTVQAGATVVQDFALFEEALRLDEVIVTGTAGGTQRRALGNSVSRVDVADATQLVAVSNMQDLLVTRAPGLQFQRVNNNVGAGSAVAIRGTGSFSLGANPLIYVDGVRVSNDAYAGPTLQGGGGESSVLSDINPADIESIEIIKGPAAATLYGTEASAGVIQIITKRGQEGGTEWDMAVRQGGIFVIDPASKLGPAWGCSTSRSAPCPEADLFQYDIYQYSNDRIADGFVQNWGSDDLYSTGQSQNYDLSVRGGTSNIRYFLSGNYADDVGTLWYNTDERYSVRTNVTAIFSSDLTMDASASWLSGDTRYGEPVIAETGILRVTKLSVHECMPQYVGPPVDCTRRGAFQDFRPDDVADIHTTRAYERFTAASTLTHTVGDWFTQRAVLGLDKRWDINQVLAPRVVTKVPVIARTREGQLDREDPTETNFSLDYAASGVYELNPNIRLTTSVGAQYYQKVQEQTTLVGRGFPTGVSTTINQTSLSQLSLGYNYAENRSLGFFVQEEVALNDRLFVTGAIRRDDNSAFGADFDAQYYPKVSATWVLSEESFWGIEPINSFRVRSAWGKAGRQPGTLAGINTLTTYRGIAGRSSIGPQSPGNSDVGPEVSQELEVGFDVAFLNDRVSGEFTYFTQQTKEALLGQSIPTSLGFPGSVQANVGQINNWGWEATLSSRLYESPAFSFDLDVGADHIMNEIKDLGNTFLGTTGVRVGLPYPAVYTNYKVLSADFVSTNVFANAMCDAGVFLGSDSEPDANRGTAMGGATVPCAGLGNQRLLVGPTFPTYTYTISPTISLLNNSLQLYSSFEGVYGRTHEDSIIEWSCAIYRECLDSWLLNDPVYLAGCHYVCPYPDETLDHYYDGDFWRMREVGMRYQIPESVVSRIGVDRASLAFSGRDIWTPWKREDHLRGVPIVDPDQGSNSATNSGNFWKGPIPASVHATLRVTF